MAKCRDVRRVVQTPQKIWSFSDLPAFVSKCWPLLSHLSFSLQTDYFHLFLCVAIIVLYGEDVTEQQLATDQMLLHFSNLSMHMNGELVLRKVSIQSSDLSRTSATTQTTRAAIHIKVLE